MSRDTTVTNAKTPRDEGSALIIVLATMTVLSMFVSVALTHALRTSSSAQRATAWNQAFAAAEAGVDDYLARLIANDGYWRTVDCTNPALQGPTTRANNCGWDTSTEPGWLRVPGSDRADFHVDVDVSDTPIDGTIDLIATGRVSAGSHATRGATRTIQVTLRRGGFGEFLYYTDYETKDPADYSDPTTAAARCRRHYWDNPQRDLTYCKDIQFISGDRLDGPVHSNDAMLIAGSTLFTGAATTSLPACRSATGVPPPATSCYRRANGANPTFQKGLAYRSPVDMPDSIGDLRQYVDPARTTTPGCLYTGPTRIVFNAPNGGPATMKVWSHWSTTILNPACGNPALDWPQTVAVPDNNLIMVQDVPSTQPSQPPSGPCLTGTIGDGYPVADDYNQTLWDAKCRFGTALVEGTLKGRLTISADNNIVVTDDLVYAGGDNGADVLGLIAENSVQIYHPVGRRCDRWGWGGTCWSWSRTDEDLKGPDGTFNTNPKVNAAILTLQHSFEVQAYDAGSPQGSIHLYGAIAQRFRGIVGTGNGGTGYLKDYHYDSRLRYAPPPYFLDPVRSGWGQKTFGEIAPRYGG